MRITGAVLRESGASLPYASSRPLDVVSLELASPGPGEVRIRIETAGLCHSDLSVVNGSRPRPLPMLLGHEAAGIVDSLGEGVEDLAVGQRVVTVFLPRCESCAACRTGGRLPCEAGTLSNNDGVLPSQKTRLSENGSPIRHHLGVSAFATHAIVSRRSIVPVGDDVPPNVAAVLGCAVLTGGGAVKNAGALQPGQDIIVIGLGGVGMAAILTGIAITSAAGGRVIGVDAIPAKLEAARTLGANIAVTPEDALALNLRAPVVVEAAGNPLAFETAFALTAPGGITVTTGLPPADATSRITPLTVTAEARTIVGSYLGSAVPSRDIPEYEKLWREGKLPVEKLTSTTLPLASINEALDALDRGYAIRQMITFEGI
ncbi:alcohol dehydrogenase catalytic domain-containing protein [Gulosibacter molinativorax]|uniref:Alcohol dehydrogenase n=1 Tax=Gulosibacter molinativorax TaxID=256821 RepID=A0ABT7C850_9MICO|nr:alcohol dehydrogenase catalytic domain-containing protein [Gulosibacter molinativorax]MDJ1371396.1 alcohol dehydrogenase [Gulosibacter molinativorax]QUY62894.1 GroES-like protein [Gulosibacter molinativorax]